jgi:hypothetical protein
VLREALLLLVAMGSARVVIMFVVQGMLARLAIPRILATSRSRRADRVRDLPDESRRRNSGTITTSVIFRRHAPVLREPLENLWAALRRSSTTCAGSATDQDGGRERAGGRYLLALHVDRTNNGETVIIPNVQLMKNRVTVSRARRSENPLAARIEFFVSDVPPARVIAVVEAELARRKSAMWR